MCFARRDKYEPDVREFWIDVKVTGELKKTISEVTIRRFEVADVKSRSIPTPLSMSGGPMVPGFDERESSDEISGSEDSDGSNNAKNKRPMRAPTSDFGPSKKRAAEQASIEEVLEEPYLYWALRLLLQNSQLHFESLPVTAQDIENVPTMLSTILKTQSKAVATVEKLKGNSSHLGCVCGLTL